jgi:aspartate/methionine/tyrosine aminotransferase
LVQDVFLSVPGVQVIQAQAAFYTSVLIPSIPLCDLIHPPFTPELNLVLANTWKTASSDTRFCLWLLIQTGICLVPLSSFGGRLQGFRMTVLQKDEALFELLLKDLNSSLKQAQLLKAA